MKKECPTCGGTGQVGFFQGVSRFLLSWDECPGCCGIGFTELESGQAEERAEKEPAKKSQSQKKKKS